MIRLLRASAFVAFALFAGTSCKTAGRASCDAASDGTCPPSVPRPPEYYDTATCRELHDDFITTMNTLDRSCEQDSDCTTLGAEPSYRYCDGYPAIGLHIGGTAASGIAYTASPSKPAIDRMIAEWNERCAGRKDICSGPSGVTCIADAAQWPTKCVDHRCTEQGDSCL